MNVGKCSLENRISGDRQGLPSGRAPSMKGAMVEMKTIRQVEN